MTSPLLDAKDFGAPSVFQPAALLREARRQKTLPEIAVPPACLLDPDGDIVAHLLRTGRARPHPGWACYHTDLFTFDLPGVAHPVGVIGRAVGAPFAVLLAEQLFASGCATLLSITSSGRIAKDLPAAPHFLLIDRALRDEGTSHHYLPPSAFAAMPEPALIEAAAVRLAAEAPGITVLRGATWTTDAPFRETAAAIATARAAGCLAVEMEAAALYAFATATRRRVLCVAHVTNAMGQDEGDFEKGEADGAADALQLLSVLIRTVLPLAENGTLPANRE
ncbi:nucleoside phosphorylase [Elioraea sp.]|uniref:nucleoside phosphorylase n=1 Tax=Elioraea sp. TaxID=2185103 RepID=UPI0025C58EC0|nr:nucleoside phosphorylase [Elioraea sp.]